LDKVCLATEAAKVGLATPEGQVCANLEGAPCAAQTFGFPVLVKGVRTIVEVDGRLVRYPSRLVLHERGLRATQKNSGPALSSGGEQGNVMSFAGVATDRGLLGSVVSRYRRTWPPNAGMASFLETIRPPVVVRRLQLGRRRDRALGDHREHLALDLAPVAARARDPRERAADPQL
jgi:hypothetical protein